MNRKIVKEVVTDFNGEEEPFPLKWMIACAAAALLAAGLFLISPYKGVVVSWVKNLILPRKSFSTPNVEKPDPSQTLIQDPVKEEQKPSMDKPEMSKTEQTPPVGQKINTAEEKKPLGQS